MTHEVDPATEEVLLSLLRVLRAQYDAAYRQMTDWNLRSGTAYPHIMTATDDTPSV